MRKISISDIIQIRDARKECPLNINLSYAVRWDRIRPETVKILLHVTLSGVVDRSSPVQLTDNDATSELKIQETSL